MFFFFSLTSSFLPSAKAKRPFSVWQVSWYKKKSARFWKGSELGSLTRARIFSLFSVSITLPKTRLKIERGHSHLCLVKSNAATDLPEEQRISDDDILHNINTFMFAGSDTTSLALTWTLVLLAKFPDWQTRLRNELLSIRPSTPHATLSTDEVESLYTVLSALPLLHNVCRESLRLIPPVHSSLRVATRDDIVPVSAPFTSKDGILRDSILVPKGTFVHVPVEAMNLDKEIWGPDAWQFK